MTKESQGKALLYGKKKDDEKFERNDERLASIERRGPNIVRGEIRTTMYESTRAADVGV